MADKIKNGVHDYTDESKYVYPESPAVREHLEWFRGLKLGLMMHWMPSCQFGSFESWPLSEDSVAWSRKDIPAVREHLEWFRGLKLGLMMHWMPSCQFGSFESWPLSEDSVAWSRKDIDWTDDMKLAMQQYKDCNKTFHPFKFRPDQWARLARECGFKYLLFTTKHHDGFCMYDSNYSDYKITAPDCPFHTSERADIVKSMFDAFRKEGLAISAYFSKPDWHSPYYWSPDFPEPQDRNVNYSIAEHPEIWEKFTEYTHNQITELCTNYGKVDVLWLDGGQVRPDNRGQDIRLGEVVEKIRTEYTHNQITELCTNYGKVDVLWLDGGQVRPDNRGQDIRLGEVVEKIRASSQPHLIVCDRTVGGPYENIITPEGGVPAEAMDVPWEACIPIGSYFAFHYDDRCREPRELVHLFLEIISKGGSLALNVTPRPDGKLPADQIHAMRCMGRFLNTNAEGIYGTKIAPCRPEREYRYTAKGNCIYLFYQYQEYPYLPPRLYPDVAGRVRRVTLLRTGQEIPFCRERGALLLDTSGADRNGAEYADCFRIELEEEA